MRPGGPAFGRPASFASIRPTPGRALPAVLIPSRSARERAARLALNPAGAGAPPRAYRFVGAGCILSLRGGDREDRPLGASPHGRCVGMTTAHVMERTSSRRAGGTVAGGALGRCGSAGVLAARWASTSRRRRQGRCIPPCS